jgi:hypothetical protein
LIGIGLGDEGDLDVEAAGILEFAGALRIRRQLERTDAPRRELAGLEGRSLRRSQV